MLKFKIATENETRIGLGIEAENVRRLQAGQPIAVDMTELGYPGLKLMIFYGRDMGDLYKQVEPLIGPDTQIHTSGE